MASSPPRSRETRPGGVGIRPGRHRGGPRVQAPVEKPKDFKRTLLRLAGLSPPADSQADRCIRVRHPEHAVHGSSLRRSSAKVPRRSSTESVRRSRRPKRSKLPRRSILLISSRSSLTLVALYVLSALFSYIQQYIMAGVAQTTVYDLRRDVDDKLSRLPLEVLRLPNPRGDSEPGHKRRRQYRRLPSSRA